MLFNPNTIILAGLIIFVVVLGHILMRLAWKKPDWKTSIESRLTELASRKMDPRLKLIEMDKLAEYALQQRFSKEGYGLGELLKAHKSKFSQKQLDLVWNAHKLRNKLVHEVDFDVEELYLKNQIRNLQDFVQSLIY